MKYVSIDTETTGLDPETCELIQIGMVIEDTSQDVPVEELPTFDGVICRPVYQGEPCALSMHADLLGALATEEGKSALRDGGAVVSREAWVLVNAKRWLRNHLGEPPYVAAGKNLGSFDFRFLPKSFTSLFHHRLIDAGSAALALRPDLWGEAKPPGLSDLIEGEVAHTAVEDAQDVIRFLRTTYLGCQGEGETPSSFDFQDGNGPVPAARHRNPDGSEGGWVADTATVAPTATVGPNAHVYGAAKVYGAVRVFGTAWVFGTARVYGDAQVSGAARVSGDARVSGAARVSGDAWVFGTARVYGDAQVFGTAWVFGTARVYGDAQVFGTAEVSGAAKVYGAARVFGTAQVFEEEEK